MSLACSVCTCLTLLSSKDQMHCIGVVMRICSAHPHCLGPVRLSGFHMRCVATLKFAHLVCVLPGCRPLRIMIIGMILLPILDVQVVYVIIKEFKLARWSRE